MRLALSFMAKHDIPVSSPNYAVCYEYVLKREPALCRALDDRLAADGSLSPELLTGLYRRHVAECDREYLEEVRSELRQMLDDIRSGVNEAGGEVSRFGQALSRHSDALGGDLDVAQVQWIVEDLRSSAQQMPRSGRALEERLNDHGQEMDRLRAELAAARREAATDPLTGLANRRALFMALERLAAEPHDELCLLILDIDHFKHVNDTYGHLIGDKVLQHVAATLKGNVKGHDVVARYGGEEFAVLLPQTPLAGAIRLAENLRAAVEATRLVRRNTREPLCSVTVSVGCAVHQRGEALEAFVERADRALYRSKRNGRNRVTDERAA